MTSSSGRRPIFPIVAMGIAMVIPMVAGILLTTRGFADDTLPESIAKPLKKYRIPGSAVSLEVRELGGDGPLLSLNAGTPRNPASVIKLLTTLSALELLGPDYKWQTSYLADGVIKNGVLHGDLIFQGGGDPFLTVDRMLGHLLALRQAGLKTINGDLVIDNSWFALAQHNRGAFDGKAERLYNVGPDAALTNFSATRFVIEPRGNQIRVIADPPLANLKIDNRIKSQKGKCINRNAGWSYHMERTGENLTARFRGTYRPRCGTHSISRSILANTDYTYRLFKSLWHTMGGELKGGYRVSIAPEGAETLLTLPSEPLADIITSINKFSNNVMSRQLLLTIGAELYDKPGTVEAGVIGIMSWLTANGLFMPELVIENGSGLSRKSRVTASNLSALLERGWNSTYRPEFVSSLSLAAIDGTMQKRLKKSPLRGRARIKTGLINGVRSMAGYVHARNNRYYSVVMMIDSGKVNFWNGNLIQDAVLQWVYDR